MTRQIMKWLPEPTSDDVAASRNLTSGRVEIDTLVRLSRFEWDAGGLRRLANGAIAVCAPPDAAETMRQANIQFVRVLVFSNATANHLSKTLVGSGIRHGLMIRPMIVEYEDPIAFLERDAATIKSFAPDIVVLNIDSHAFALSPALGDAREAAEIAHRAVARLHDIRNHLRAALDKPVIVQTISPDPQESRLHIDSLLEGSYRDLIRLTNAGIATLAREAGDLLLDVASLAENVGLESWFAPRYWAMAKYPFAPDMAPLYAEHLSKLIALRFGKSRRVLVLDLDNTLWGGIVGDDGKDNLILGKGSPAGEAYVAIQRMAKSLRDRGIVLCVSSKNDETIALDAFRSHPEMVLSENDIAVFQVNWKDKAENISALAEIFSLGLDSFVFVDDNPAERARVRFALPDVAVPELPKDVTEWLTVLQAANYFEATGYTGEDRERSSYYRANARRAEQLKIVTGHDDYLRSLNMEIEIRAFDGVGRKRIAQLIAKSNQFNLTTKRYSESEVAAIEDDPSLITFQARLSDIFGDNGMISVVIARRDTDALDIDTWLMSCRVLGRGVPELLLDRLVDEAGVLGKSFIRGTYIPTAKNTLVARHYENLGFMLIAEQQNGLTRWQLAVADYVRKSPPIRVLEELTTE